MAKLIAAELSLLPGAGYTLNRRQAERRRRQQAGLPPGPPLSSALSTAGTAIAARSLGP